MGRRFPGLDGFAGAILHDATVATGASGKTATMGAAGRFTSPWLRVDGAALTFAKSSTATGTLLARRSRGAVPPDIGTGVIWTPPASPQILFDPSQSLTSQGWTGTGADTETYNATDGTRRIQKSGAWGVSKSGSGLITGGAIRRFQYRLRLGFPVVSPSGFYMDFGPPIATLALVRMALLGSDYGAGRVGEWYNNYAPGPSPADRLVPGYLWDVDFLVTTPDGATAQYAELRMRRAGTIGAAPECDFWSADGFRHIANVGTATYAPNSYGLAQAFTTTGTDVYLGPIALWADDTDGTTTVTDGATLGALADATWVQIDGPQAGGTINLIGVYDGDAPDAPDSVTAQADTGGIIRAHVPTVAGIVAYRWVRKAAGTPVETVWTEGPGACFTGVADGTYTVECEVQGATGRLSGATASGSVTLPVDTEGTDPPGPVLVRIPQPPSRPEVRTVPDQIQIQEPVAGTAPVASLRLLTAASLTDEPQIDDSQDTNPVDADAVTYDDAGWSTNLPWIRGEAWYWVEAVDAQGRATRSLPFWGGEQAAFELTLGGEIDPDRLAGLPLAQWVVEVRVEVPVTLGGRTYPRETYRGAIDPQTGAWAVAELPRGQVALVKLPHSDWRRWRLPDASTAAYGSLEPA